MAIIKHNIFLVDDHVLLRDALAAYIDNFDGCRVVGLAADGLELTQKIDKGTQPDIVILDLNMPRMDGYATAEWLKNTSPM
jgi:two-component system, NarL family, invasion response regulator UvrY